MIKGKNILSRLAVTLMATVMTFGYASVKAQARESIDTSKKGSLAVTYKFGEDKLFDGVNSHIYKIASATENGTFVLDPGYDEKSSIKDLNGITDEATAQQEWKQVLEDVKDYAVKEHQPDQSAVSSRGLAQFSNVDLGIYLVCADNYLETDSTYVFAPFLVAVPQLDDNDSWVYSGSATAKTERFDRMVDLELHKRWNDEGYSDKRPSSINVKILKDGADYATVTLDKSNDWTYKWQEKPGFKWEFKEVLPENSRYSASVSSSVIYNADVASEIYTITNTYNPPSSPPPSNDETPSGGGDTTPDETPVPDVLGAVRKLAELPAVLGARRLPQTGQLWWPLPILIIAGLALIIKGIRKTHNN
ncbi:MAG: Cna B-type domain-containing protein [Butyrivibrio sp.]|nr:Cna B-type domain-containing protein [Butyrivibrio sp.]